MKHLIRAALLFAATGALFSSSPVSALRLRSAGTTVNSVGALTASDGTALTASDGTSLMVAP